jgi:DNA-binding transcriptional ArsR family regulator
VGRAERQPKTAEPQCAKRVENDNPHHEEDLIRALNHRLRREILRLLHSSPGPLSPRQIERELKLGSEHGNTLSTVSYHATVLAEFNAICLVNTRRVRGAVEHFYASRVSDTAWVLGLLCRTQESDGARLWPNGRHRADKKAARKKQR